MLLKKRSFSWNCLWFILGIFHSSKNSRGNRKLHGIFSEHGMMGFKKTQVPFPGCIHGTGIFTHILPYKSTKHGTLWPYGTLWDPMGFARPRPLKIYPNSSRLKNKRIKRRIGHGKLPWWHGIMDLPWNHGFSMDVNLRFFFKEHFPSKFPGKWFSKNPWGWVGP